jgi:hypothetical protein
LVDILVSSTSNFFYILISRVIYELVWVPPLWQYRTCVTGASRYCYVTY